jgi:hypothetical protein
MSWHKAAETVVAAAVIAFAVISALPFFFTLALPFIGGQ